LVVEDPTETAELVRHLVLFLYLVEDLVVEGLPPVPPILVLEDLVDLVVVEDIIPVVVVWEILEDSLQMQTKDLLADQDTKWVVFMPVVVVAVLVVLEVIQVIRHQMLIVVEMVA
jgi:hypothetical protein